MITEKDNNIPNQDNTSYLSTLNTITTQQQLPIQQRLTRMYDSPPSLILPSEHSTHTTPHIFPQQGSSNNKSNKTFDPSNTTIESCRNSLTHYTQPASTIDTLHTDPPSNYTTSRNLSKPPFPTVPTNPLSYRLTVLT